MIITTNEKADSLLRHKADWLNSVTLLVADEIHLVRDPKRGPTLEMVIARLRGVRRDMQVLALSATIRNARELAEWLGAELVESDWRPVELREGVYFSGEIYFGDGRIVEVPERYDPVTDLVLDCLRGGGQALVFASTRNSTVRYSRLLAPRVERMLSRGERALLSRASSEILGVEKNSVTVLLAEYVKRGVAFHHAGLSHAIRKIVEDWFRRNSIKVVVATPTLAAGVNLPARRVVISDYRRYNVELGYHESIPVIEYKQMAGRAGRPQYDKYGEAVLVARTVDELDFLLSEYVRAEPEKIYSRLASEKALRFHVLASIASGYADTAENLLELIGRTLYARQFDVHGIGYLVESSINFLEEHGFVVKREEKRIEATSLGRRVSQLYIDPGTALVIIEGLKSRDHASPLGYLHLVCATPDTPRLYLRRREEEKYDEVVRARYGEFLLPIPEDPEDYEFFLAEVKAAKLLEDWIEEKSDDYLIREYDVGPGDVYGIVQRAEWLLYSACELAKELGMYTHVPKLAILRERVKHGVKEELLELTRIKGIGRARARVLYNSGYRTLEDLRRASVAELSKLPLIGPKIAKSIKEYLEGEIEAVEVGEEVEEITIDSYF